MKRFLRENMIRIAISVVVILIVVGFAFSYYNRVVMKESLDMKAETEMVTKEVKRIYENVQQMDISVRGYALIRKPQFLFWTAKSVKDRNNEIYRNLDSLFKLQNFPEMRTYEQLKQAMAQYSVMFSKMIVHLDNQEDSLFIDMLAFDHGKAFFDKFSPFEAAVKKFESELLKASEDRYQAAESRNAWVQWLLLLIGVPTLGWIFYKLGKDERQRRALLLDLERNNRLYLFNDGERDQEEAKVILNSSIENLQKASSFVNQISEGNYDVVWDGMNASNAELNQSNLAGRLVYMRDEMKKVKEEDRKRMWTTQGLSEFSEIIRKHQASLEELTFTALTFLVKYTGSQQGSLFLLQDEAENPHLKLTACYAFDRRKFVDKTINIGEGLLGQTFLEGQTLLLKKVPKGYVSITSGLGHATPTCVVIVPMKHNEQVVALIELATFVEFLPYQVSFLEKAGEFIASAIATAQQSERNKGMMDQMQQQTTQLRAQEEELRQNLEELEATQEAMRRKNVETEQDIWNTR